MSNESNWFEAILNGYREIQVNGQPVNARRTLNFINLQVLDDAVNKRTNVTFSGPYIPTPDAVPNTVVSRTGAGGTAVTALSVMSDIPPSGVQTAYINGAAGTMYADNGFIFQSTTVTQSNPYIPIYDKDLWDVDTYGRIFTLVIDPTDAVFDLDVPDGSVLLSVTVYIQPAIGHGGSLPAEVPIATIVQREAVGVGTAVIALQSDTSADETAYETPHGITVDSTSIGTMPVLIDRTAYNYVLKFTSELGLAGATILGIVVVYSTNRYRK